MQKMFLIIVIILCICGIVGAAYTFNKFSGLVDKESTEQTEEPTEDPSTCKHKKEVVLNAVEPTCYKNGYSEGRMCSDCGTILVEQQIIDKLSHTPIIIPAEESTCISKGHSVGSKCSTCHEVLVRPEELSLIECDFSGYAPEVESTCSVQGHRAYFYCVMCGTPNSAIEYYPLAAHDAIVSVEALEPTCYSVGHTEEKRCIVCMEVVEEPVIIPMIEHVLVTLQRMEASCSNTGLTEGKKCSVCDTIVIEQEIISKLPHNFVEMETIVADCSNNGRSGGTECSECGACGESPTFTPSLGHYYGDDFTDPCDRCHSYYINANDLGFTKESSGEYTITSIGEFCATTMIIPSTYNNCNITAIANGAITSSKVETVLVGSNIISIEINAFKNCTNLRSVFIPANVKFVSAAAFIGCSNLTDIYIQFTEEQLPDTWDDNWAIALPEACRIHYLSNDAVLYEFSYSLNSDGNSYSVTGLESDISTNHSFVIPSTYDGLPVTEIADEAFKGKANIFEIRVPTSVKSIGNSAFSSCYDLKKVIFDGDIKLGSRVFENCYNLDTVNTIKVTEMGAYCFLETALTVIELSPKLTTIPQYAFYSCDNLTSVYINEGTTIILDKAFAYCDVLTNIYLPDGLEHIATGVFGFCNSLESIYIPETVTKMGVNLSGSARGNVFFTTGNLVINCGADSQPEGWYDGWNVSRTDPETDEILEHYPTNWGEER